MRLTGKNAVVTGGSRGIGVAVAEELSAAGAAVVVAARSERQIEEVATQLRADGHVAHAIRCDVTEPASVARLVAESTERLGHVDILVNNAGVAWSRPVERVGLDEWNALFAVNVTGVLLCTQAFLPGMKEAGWGRIVNVASVAGKVGAPYIAAYAATKHAVVGFTRSVAAEVATEGITVNAVCPGYVDTDMTTESVKRIVGKTGISEAEALDHMKRMSPQGRIFEASEVAYLVGMLCDPRARGVNGQSLVLDGGAVQS